MVLAYFGLVILRPGLPENLAFVDLVIGVFVIGGLISMCNRGSIANGIARRSALWIWLIFLGSIIGLMGVGVPIWALSSLVRLLSALLAFFAFLHLFLTANLLRYALIGTWLGWGLNSLYMIFVEGWDYRPTAFFQHPNYPSHYCALATAVLLATTRPLWLRAVIVVLAGLTLYKTASFGGMAMVISMVSVVVVRGIGQKGIAIFVTVAAAAVLVALVVVGPEADIGTQEDVEVSSTINQQRFDRSRDSRFELWSDGIDAWSDRPAGVGPDGVKNRRIGTRGDHVQEIHADVLGYLVERGPVGLIGLLGLWVVLWKAAPRRGLARIMMVGILVGGLFRETMHYRHVWLLLAVAFALDIRRRAGPSELPEPDAEDEDNEPVTRPTSGGWTAATG
jgi:hypothetical protein